MPKSDRRSQQVVWNDRAEHWNAWGFGEPLAPNEAELEFQVKYIVPESAALVLGATKSLCQAALERTSVVTAVDFASAAVAVFAVQRATYVCQDWLTFLEATSDTYDNILTDNGLICLEFPSEWHEISHLIYQRLKPGGVFSARAFLSTQRPPKKHYTNPNLARIMPAIGRAEAGQNWTVVKPAKANGERYPARYVFPPSAVFEKILKAAGLVLIEKWTPSYEEGDHFVSFAFRRPFEELSSK